MEIVSKDRVSQLGRQLVAQMEKTPAVRFLKDRETTLQAVTHVLLDALRRDEERQQAVAQRIAQRKNPPPPGSKDWDALFRTLLDDEYERQGFELS